VLGSGMSVGVLAADMQRDWSVAEGLRQQAELQAAAATQTPEPVVVTVTKIRHVTPEPIVVHKKVYRTVRGKAPAQGRTTSRATKSSGGSSSGSTTTSRKVVAPAPAPAPATAKAPAATTSKTS